jgi:hypothetical protein
MDNIDNKLLKNLLATESVSIKNIYFLSKTQPSFHNPRNYHRKKIKPINLILLWNKHN